VIRSTSSSVLGRAIIRSGQSKQPGSDDTAASRIAADPPDGLDASLAILTGQSVTAASANQVKTTSQSPQVTQRA
jgi:hypothetical protein